MFRKKKKGEEAEAEVTEEETVIETEEDTYEGDNKGSDDNGRTPHRKTTVIGAIRNYPHWVAQTFHDWLNGTEDRPLPFLGLRDRFKCWRMIRSGRYVYLRVLTFDRQMKWWDIKEDLIRRSEMPEESVHCTNEKGTFLLPLEKIKFDPREDYGFGAHNAFNYMKDNTFEEAQMAAGVEQKGVPLKYLGMFAIGAVVIVMYMLTVMQ